VTIRFAPQAEADFVTVIGYLAERNPVAAQAFGERILALIDKLAAGDFEGAEQTLVSGEVVRSWPVPPVRIYYQRQADAFWILRSITKPSHRSLSDRSVRLRSMLLPACQSTGVQISA
jgi:plasmid stabilization system protein ParE